jgi:peptidoglycan/LPS O-acetylase OafA/YrhL
MEIVKNPASAAGRRAACLCGPAKDFQDVMLRPVKNVEIEYLRAVAVILVIGQHLATLLYWTPPWLNFFFTYARTYTGVDLFFCISGFVIASSLLRELDEIGDKKGPTLWAIFKAFWIRRAFRILPAAWLWVAFALLVSLLSNETDLFGPFWVVWKIALSILLFVFNDYYLYVARSLHQAVPDNLGPYWSLSLEEQFYFLFPILLSFRKKEWLVGGFLLLIIVQFFFNRSSPMDNALWPNRLDTLMWGVLIAFFQRTVNYRVFDPISLRAKPLAAISSIVLILLIGIVAEALHEIRIAAGLISLLCATFVWLASYEKNYVIPVGRRAGKVLEWIGSRSYALYLVHMPAYLLTRYAWLQWTDVYVSNDSKKAFTIPMIISAILVMGLLSELTHRLVEKPFRQKGRQLSNAYLARMRNEFPKTTSEDRPLKPTD